MWTREQIALGTQYLEQPLRAGTFSLVVEGLWLGCGDHIKLRQRVDPVAIVAFGWRRGVAVVQCRSQLDQAGAQRGQLGDEFAVLFFEDAHSIERFVAQILEVDGDSGLGLEGAKEQLYRHQELRRRRLGAERGHLAI